MTDEKISKKALKIYPIPEDNNPTIHQQHCFGRQGSHMGIKTD